MSAGQLDGRDAVRFDNGPQQRRGLVRAIHPDQHVGDVHHRFDVGRIVPQDAVVDGQRLVVFVTQFGELAGHELGGDVRGDQSQGLVDHFLTFAVTFGLEQHAGQFEIGIRIVDAVARGVAKMLDGFVCVASQEQHASDPALHVGIVRSEFGGTSKQLPGPFLVRLSRRPDALRPSVGPICRSNVE